ncbi:hypothetical protein R5R35_013144 [Gryllus longicercus]|uniref:UBC core domain-containing protein n=1 Tax=Gryllus longicercus TaxID=2509291 RepID=A0AAN9ZJJ7_9ORTH
MDNLAPERLIKDFARVVQDLTLGVCVSPENGNFLLWNGVMFGPTGTPYEDGTFKIQLEFTKEYPTTPPVVRFMSKMFHPNVHVSGIISIDILDKKWSHMHDVAYLLMTIQSVLKEPNLSLATNAEAATLFVKNRMEYDRRVSETVQWSWNHNPDDDENVSENEYENDVEELQNIITCCLKYNPKLYYSTNN